MSHVVPAILLKNGDPDGQLSKEEYQELRQSLASSGEPGLSPSDKKLEEKLRKQSRKDTESFDALKRGVACRIHTGDIHPYYNKASGEKVIEGKNNNYIVFGRDRPRGMMSGYGGKGYAQSGMIDLVVGRHGIYGQHVDEQGKKLFLDNSPELDAARIYISQRTDADKEFGITVSGTPDSRNRSAIVIKADDVRITARENIKIVTGVDRWNSKGFQPFTTGGIHLIAGNDALNLQPMVLGGNLVECLKDITEEALATQTLSLSLAKWALKTTTYLLSHTHVAVGFGFPTTPSLEIAGAVASGTMIKDLTDTVQEAIKNLTNKTVNNINYLNPVTPLVDNRYILSKYNKTN